MVNEPCKECKCILDIDGFYSENHDAKIVQKN